MVHVNVKRWSTVLSIASVVVLIVSACGAAPTATPAPLPTAMTLAPTSTAVPAPAATTAPAATATTAANPAPAPATSANAPTTAPSLSMMKNATLGDFLTDAKGMTLYIYTPDKDGQSTCYNACAKNWPPLLTADDMVPTAPAGASLKFGFVDRTDGTYQVTYNNMPLYYYINDKATGDTTGQGKGNVWFVALTAGNAAAPAPAPAPAATPTTAAAPAPAPAASANAPTTAPMLAVVKSDTLGSFLTDDKGMTLYFYTPDKDGVSACYGGCATAWPPLLTADGTIPAAPDGITGTFGITKRTDGTSEVTYNNMPLYYYAKDKAAGDVVGQGVGNVWFVALSNGGFDSNSGAAPKLAIAHNATLGDILTDDKGMTLYIYTPDKDGASTCYAGCAKAWPPLLSPNGALPAALDGATGKFGITQRTDGTYEVTYNKMPLYYYVNDKAAGDTTGQGKGNVWYVITIGGQTTPTTTGSSGYGG
jgi:predicted lipoprotein with Yx(FWY)xxD motif